MQEKIYNFLLHPQWDEFGSLTLYLKVLYADYDKGFCIIELIGEWNDAIYNDIMILKREIIDLMLPILDALQTLSDTGLVHRDVKPENILFFNGQPCLADISLVGADAALSRCPSVAPPPEVPRSSARGRAPTSRRRTPTPSRR